MALLGACLACAAAPAAHAQMVKVRGWAPTAQRSRWARVVVPTRARARPGAGRTRLRLRTQAPWTGGPVQLLVLAARRDTATAKLWLKVRLPSRPNGASGWIDADRVRTGTTRWRLVIRRRTRTVSVYRNGHRVRRFRAVIGTPSTPTPRGLFAISEKARQPDAGAFLGPWALHLTAHSNVLTDYGGGRGRVAIHGRSGASLRDPLGHALSHGCVRIDNGPVSWLADRLVPGTPVRVVR